ncbi:hypothetical protein ACHAXR_012213 [Thalassiosira sp. AJA248-18]
MARRHPSKQPKNDEELSSSEGSSSDEESSATSSSDNNDDDGAAAEKEEQADDNDDGSTESDTAGDEKMEDANQTTTEPMKTMNNVDSDDSSDVGDDTDDEDEENQESSNATTTAVASTLPPISKSWAALTTHSPCYTGGTVAFSHAPTMTTTATAAVALPSSKEEPLSSASSQHFILAQRGGDVSIIEASTGLLLRTVRKGKLFQGGHDLSNDYNENDEDDYDDDDDEEMMDAEAITAFALSPNNMDLIAVTRSHLVRRYSLAVPADSEEEAKDGKQSKKNDGKDSKEKQPSFQSVTSITDPAKVAFSFGKSGHSLPVTKVAFHPSGIFFATGSVDGLVKVWDVRNGYATHALHPTSTSSGSGGRGRYAVSCIEWRRTTTSLILAIGREDGSICIHDLLLNAHDTKKASLPVAVLRDHLSAVTCVAWSSEIGGGNSSSGSAATASRGGRKHGGGIFFSSGRDSVINTWLISEEEETKDVGGPKRKKKKTKRDDSAPKQLPIKVSYRRIRTLPVYEQVESMVLLPRKFRPASETRDQQEILDKKDVVLATCGTKGMVRLWKATPGDKDGGIQNVISDLTPLAVQDDDEAFGEENGGYSSLNLTSLSTTHLSPMLVAIDAEHNMTFLRMHWSEDETELRLVTDRAIVGHNGEILDLSVIPQQLGSSENNGKHTVAIATNSSQVRIFGLGEANEDELGEDTQNHAALSPRGMLDGHAAIVLSIDASPCGRYLATASKDKTMRLWHIPTQKCVAVATGHTEAIGSVALSNKIGCYDVGGKAADNGAGAFVVTASKDRTLKVWPLPGSAVLNRWAADGGDREKSLNARLSARAHEKDINIVSVAPNDSLIATGSQDKQVKLWRSIDLALYGTLKGHKRGVWDCQFSPHDRVVATASGDRTLKLWSIADCSCVRTFQGHMAGVLRVRFLGTGLQLISSGSDGLLKLWTIRTNECESTMDGHDDKIWALDLSPCGTALFSGGADSKIAVWRDTTNEKDAAVREAEEQNILMEQNLSNHLRRKQYEKALEIALELDKPNQVLRVLTEIVEKDTKNSRGIETLQKHAVKWSPDRLKQMLKYCREWNTRARNSHIAMLVVKAVVTTIPAAKLASSYEGVPEILAGIAPYAERHFDRLDRMVGDSYLLDFTLFSMGSLHGSNNEDYNEWAERSKYALPQKEAEGRIQIGGSLIVGGKKNNDNDEDSDDDDDDVVTIGDSSTEASSDDS